MPLKVTTESWVYKNTYYSSQNTTNFILYYVLTVHLEQLQLHVSVNFRPSSGCVV
jgi:hypothetical protein